MARAYRWNTWRMFVCVVYPNGVKKRAKHKKIISKRMNERTKTKRTKKKNKNLPHLWIWKFESLFTQTVEKHKSDTKWLLFENCTNKTPPNDYWNNSRTHTDDDDDLNTMIILPKNSTWTPHTLGFCLQPLIKINALIRYMRLCVCL